jgi:acyl carrier protein
VPGVDKTPATPADALAALADALAEVKPTLDAAGIAPNSSLTADLGLDSLDLVELSARLTDHYGPVDLAPWLAEAMQPGGDSVASLAAFLAGRSSTAEVTR